MDTDSGLVDGGGLTAYGWERALNEAAPLGYEVAVGWSANYRSFYGFWTRDGRDVAEVGLTGDCYAELPFVASLLRAAAVPALAGPGVAWLAEPDLLAALLRAPARFGGLRPVERMGVERAAAARIAPECAVGADVWAALDAAVASIERPEATP